MHATCKLSNISVYSEENIEVWRFEACLSHVFLKHCTKIGMLKNAIFGGKMKKTWSFDFDFNISKFTLNKFAHNLLFSFTVIQVITYYARECYDHAKCIDCVFHYVGQLCGDVVW